MMSLDKIRLAIDLAEVESARLTKQSSMLGMKNLFRHLH